MHANDRSSRVEFAQIADDSSLRGDEIRSWAARRSPLSQEVVVGNRVLRRMETYVISAGTDHAGLLLIDIFPGENHVVAYELYVVRAFRRRGIARAAMNFVEVVAIRNCAKKIVIRPQPLDAGGKHGNRRAFTWLRKFYEQLGYTWVGRPRQGGQMEKEIVVD